MSTRKSLLLLGVGLLAAAAGAQTPPAAPAGAPPSPQARFEQLATTLGLSDAQKPKVQQIINDERTDLMASMKKEQDDHVDVMQAHQNHEKIEAAMLEKLKPVLSADQLTQYKGILEAEAAARHHHPAPGAPTAAAP